MRHLMILLVFILYLFSISCENDKNKTDYDTCSDSILIVGDNNVISIKVNIIDTLIYPRGLSDSAEYYIDLDSNSINDYKLVSFLQYSPLYFVMKTYITSLNLTSKILVNNTSEYPEILGLNDTIFYSDNYFSGRFSFLFYSGSNEIGTNEPDIIYGNWLDIDEKYVGLLIEGDDTFHFGWIKMGIVKHYKIHISEIAIKKRCI